MTQLTDHAKTILRAIADGKALETKFSGLWEACTTRDAIYCLYADNAATARIKPETRSINGVELAAPVELPAPYKGYLLINSKVYRFTKVEDADSWAIAICDVLEGKIK